MGVMYHANLKPHLRYSTPLKTTNSAVRFQILAFKLVQAFKFRHAGLVHLHMRRLKNPLDKTPKLLFEIVPLTSTSVASLRPQMSKFENAILHTTFAPINLRKQVTLPTPTHPFKAIPTAHPLLSDAHGNL